MAKNSPNKRKSQNKEVEQTPKKQKINEDNQKDIPKQQNTPKGDGNKMNTPKSQKKNAKKEKLEKFTGTADLQEQIKEEAKPSNADSDYEVEQEVKPEKITKTMNEDNQDDSDSEEDTVKEEIDNAVNENSENDEKKQTNEDQNKKTKHPNVDNIEEVKAFIEKESAKKKMRYVLFLGNLAYDVSTDDIAKHFEKDIQIKSIRLPIGKGPDKKPRGFGYLEVTDKDSYFNALSKHHSFIKGRRLNVLYTTGGKKNSANIKTILKKKNFKLNALRKQGKLEGGMKHSNKRSVRRAKKRSFEKKTE